MVKMKKAIIVVSIFSMLFGCNRIEKSFDYLKVYPDEEFSVIESKLKDGKPVIGSVNMAYKNYPKKRNYPWCLKVAIALDTNSLYDNGLPLPEEGKIANQLEDELMLEIKKISTAHYVGHVFNNTFLDFYVYLDKPEKIHNYLQTQINKNGLLRGFAYEINKDENWETVTPFFN